MTVLQVMNAANEALDNKKYLAMRFRSGNVCGYNPQVAKLKVMQERYDPNGISIFESYQLISFQEYISIKKPLFI